MARALLRAFAIVRDALSEAELTRLIESGNLDRLIAQAFSDDVLDRAFLPLRQQLRRTTEKGFQYNVSSLPRGGRIDGVIAIAFDHLNPAVLTALRTIESGVLANLKDDIRESVREAVRIGLEAGKHPLSVSRSIRDVIGLGPSQVQEVQNYRDALGGVNGRRVGNYTLRNRTVDRLLAKGPLASSQIDFYTEQYRKARVAQNANTVTRTATTDAYRQGQNLSWKAARDSGVIPPNAVLMKTWIQIERPDKREEHAALAGETVSFDQPYSNGSMVPGDQGEPNCGCMSRVTVAHEVEYPTRDLAAFADALETYLPPEKPAQHPAGPEFYNGGMAYHGGPRAGAAVDLAIGELMPSRMAFRDAPGGEYVWNTGRERYEWAPTA